MTISPKQGLKEAEKITENAISKHVFLLSKYLRRVPEKSFLSKVAERLYMRFP